ncbi:lipoprotein LpqH [Mycobacterium palustre]|nr:lipoprotein LpqH [Mycobacterium palustre]MCV7102731.1 lipoprotein LpqH [Mycobacterium palustre]
MSIAAAALVAGSSAACASGRATATRETEAMAPGTAQVTIDGDELPLTRAVNCAPPEKYMTTITIGDDTAGATVLVSNAGKLTVEIVRIRNLKGFTGDYDRGLGNGDATVALSDNSYRISGTAFGYATKSPEPTTESFAIKVSC